MKIGLNSLDQFGHLGSFSWGRGKEFFEEHAPYVRGLAERLRAELFRVDLMDAPGHMNKKIKQAQHDQVGQLLIFRDTTQGVERGQVLCKPGSVKPHTKFEAEAYILTKEEGGRHTPFFANYRPQFYFRTTDVTGTVALPEGTEMVMPGDNLKFNVELIAPIAMEEKLRFAIREGGRTVGAGVVTEIVE